MGVSYTYSEGLTFSYGHFLTLQEYIADYIGVAPFAMLSGDDPLELFLLHAGQGNAFTPEECALIAPALKEALDQWNPETLEEEPDEDEVFAPNCTWDEYVQHAGLNLASCMMRCAVEGKEMRFN